MNKISVNWRNSQMCWRLGSQAMRSLCIRQWKWIMYVYSLQSRTLVLDYWPYTRLPTMIPVLPSASLFLLFISHPLQSPTAWSPNTQVFRIKDKKRCQDRAQGEVKINTFQPQAIAFFSGDLSLLLWWELNSTDFQVANHLTLKSIDVNMESLNMGLFEDRTSRWGVLK